MSAFRARTFDEEGCGKGPLAYARGTVRRRLRCRGAWEAAR